MPLRRKAVATALAGAAAVVLAAARPVGAQQANPEPTSCAGVAFSDSAGDAISTRENLDVRAGFFRYVTDSAGENVLTANIQVTNLNESSEVGSYASEWIFSWTSGNTRHYVIARWYARTSPFRPGEVTYRYVAEGDDRWTLTTGRMFPGRDGIVEIVVPVDKLDLAGKRLTNPQAVSQFEYTDGLHTYPPVVADSAPDSQTAGKPFDVVPCAQEASPTAPQPTSASGQAATAPRLEVVVVVGRLSAREISRRRSLSIGLRAGEKTTALRARLTRGKKLVAAGRLASISGKGTVRLRLRGTKLRPGTYTLQLTGRTVEGQMASGRVKVRIRQ